MKEKLSWFDRIMAAVTFAEANEPEVGKEFLTTSVDNTVKQQKREECDAILATDMHGAEAQS